LYTLAQINLYVGKFSISLSVIPACPESQVLNKETPDICLLSMF